MVNPDGEWVIAEPDKASWEQFQAKAKLNATSRQKTAEEDKEVRERGLECSLDNKMFIDPMKTPCCEKTYCNDCISNALIESDFVCPGCKSEGVLLDDLKPDSDAVDKIKAYLDEKNDKARAGSKSPKPQSPQSPVAPGNPETADSQAELNKAKSKSPSPSAAGTSTSQQSQASTTTPATAPTPRSNSATPTSGDQQGASNKRPADEALENPKIPKAPKAMQKQDPQAMMMNGMPGVNGMPGMNGMNGMGMGMPMMPYGMPPMMPNFGMGMPNMGMMNPMMMNPMMAGGMGGFPGMTSGFGNTMGWGGPQGGTDMMAMGMNNGGPGGPNMNMNQRMNNGGFNPNMQQQQQHGPGFKNFSHQPADEDDAYFRKPVNPHRHQNRQRRVRPSDYREL